MKVILILWGFLWAIFRNCTYHSTNISSVEIYKHDECNKTFVGSGLQVYLLLVVKVINGFYSVSTFRSNHLDFGQSRAELVLQEKYASSILFPKTINFTSVTQFNRYTVPLHYHWQPSSSAISKVLFLRSRPLQIMNFRTLGIPHSTLITCTSLQYIASDLFHINSLFLTHLTITSHITCQYDSILNSTVISI